MSPPASSGKWQELRKTSPSSLQNLTAKMAFGALMSKTAKSGILPTCSHNAHQMMTFSLLSPTHVKWAGNEAPPFFGAVTETARDIAQQRFHQVQLPPHALECFLQKHCDSIVRMIAEHAAKGPVTPEELVHLIEVYVDDFIVMLQATDIAQLDHIACAVLHSIHDVFPPLEITNSPLPDPASVAKMQSEGFWHTEKEILGWLFNGRDRTISLITKKFDKLTASVNDLLTLGCCPVKSLHKLKGSLQFVAQALAVGKPVLGQMDYFMRQHCHLSKGQFVSTTHLTEILQDWLQLLRLMRSRPISVFELVPTPPAYI
jgi:hypothetical protein